MLTGSAAGLEVGVKRDAIDRHLIAALSQDGRRAAADLAKELGLSRQAVAERMRLLEESGVVRGYRADVAPECLGLEVHALVRLQVDGTLAAEREQAVRRVLAASPHVRAVYHVTGEDCFVADVVCRHIADVNVLLDQLKQTRAVQSSRTAFVLETVLERRSFGPVDAALLDGPEPAERVVTSAGRAVARRSRRPAGTQAKDTHPRRRS